MIVRGREIVAMIAIVGLVACKRGGEPSRSPGPTPFDEIAYHEGALGPDVRVLLVAGGDDIANFAAEVVEQRELWKEAGLRDEQIACYWAKPRPRAWQRDRKQYSAVAEALRNCHAATPARVLADLRALAAREPKWIYLFVTAHGLDSIAGLWREDAKARATVGSMTAAERATVEVPALALQADRTRTIENAPAILAALRKGADARELVVTPATLGEALAAFPAATRKIAVLQGCYSGGFVRDEAIAGLRNLVVLTASAHDRPSFGCGSGDARTWFGGAFNRVLARMLEPGKTPAELDWRRIYEEVAFVIDVMESIDGERPSKPVYFERGR